MNNEQTHNRLSELITISGIYEAIKSLEINLATYLESEQANAHRYSVVMRQLELEQIISQLKDQLTTLTHCPLE